MHLSIFKAETTTTVLLLFCVLCCSDDTQRDRKQFKELEIALDLVAVEQDPHWMDKVENAEKVPVESDTIRKVQKMCVSAYREYAAAMDEMDDSRRQLDALEKAIANGQVDNLVAKHNEARLAIDQTSMHLEQSQLLIRQCMLSRQKLKSELKLVRN
ncbi:MAG: hypothetical protein JXR76_30225 [Deltaproteobacteria bacterium]|nr:hypothetical protein [Deltaproteobacteria bacterium]